jgi:hypothetical protein
VKKAWRGYSGSDHFLLQGSKKGQSKIKSKEKWDQGKINLVGNLELLEEIRTSTHKGIAVGKDRFKEEIEALTGRRVKSKKRGRPVGWRKERV